MNSIKNILFKFADKKILFVIELLLFMSLIGITTSYPEVLKKQEVQMALAQEPEVVKTYTNSDNSTSSYYSGMEELIQCYRKGNDILSSGIKEKVDELNTLFSQDSANFSFLYKDIYSGFTVSYNEDSPIFTASTIKAPAMIYLYEKASKDEIDLNEELIYTSNFYSGGSGVLKNMPQNTSYKVDTLIEYAIRESDNIAYGMLMNRYNKNSVLDFWRGFDTKYIFTLNTIWGVTSAHDASIYMSELYDFYLRDKTYGSTLMEHFKSASWKLITDKNGDFNTANKGGYSGSAIHDVAIVFDKNPYILVIMSNRGEGSYMQFFSETSKIIGELHELYWMEKSNECSNIKQY